MEQAGIGPDDGHMLVGSGDTTYGGRSVVNPSGGLISKGHPLGATGLAPSPWTSPATGREARPLALIHERSGLTTSTVALLS